MFWKKSKCKRCESEIKPDYNYCPYCGEELTETPENIFEEIDKEFEKVDKMFGFKPVKGVSIMISGGAGIEPRVEVKNLGYKKPETRAVEKIKEKPVRTPRTTEEPETKISRTGNRQVINIRLPGVRMEDIEIKRLEQSIEVRAFADDKTYFKLIPIPSNASVNRSFEDEMLKIEIQR